MRDDAIMSLASMWRSPTAEQQALVDSISDPEKRSQAKIRQIYNVARTNPTRARELLQDLDVSGYQRQRLESYLNQFGVR